MISLLRLLCYMVWSLVRNFRVLYCMLLSISGKLSSFFIFFCKSALQQYSVKFIGFALNLFSFLTGMWIRLYLRVVVADVGSPHKMFCEFISSSAFICLHLCMETFNTCCFCNEKHFFRKKIFILKVDETFKEQFFHQNNLAYCYNAFNKTLKKKEHNPNLRFCWSMVAYIIIIV